MATRCPQPDPAYAAACSAQTLCSARRGFLRTLLPDLAALPGDDWLQGLEPMTDAARLQACRDHQELMEALGEVMSRVAPLSRGKDARVSRERRRAAEEQLATAGDAGGAGGEAGAGEDRLERALALASEAVLRAPVSDDDDEATLALALWTRSAALLARERAGAGAAGGARGQGGARAALADLRLALRAHLPAKMRAHYYWRTGHCYKECGEATRAKVSYELALRLLRADDEQRARLQQDLDALDLTQPPPEPDPATDEVSVTGGAKPNMPSLSKLVKIVEEEGKGRYAAARAPVSPGDVLLAEPPYAACLLPDHLGTHCLHCFTRLSLCAEEAAVWCPRCAGVAFCSLRCRERGMRYHQHECSFQDLYIGSGMSILCHIALRMVTQLGLTAALAAHARHIAADAPPLAHDDIEGGRRAKMKTRKERLNRTKKGLKINTEDDKDNKEEKKDADEEENLELKTAQIYSLCTHSEQRTGEDYVKRLVVAVFLTECLHKGGLFESCAEEDLETSRWAITALLVRNLQLLQFNAHEVFETLRAGGRDGAGRGGHLFRGARAQHIAVAIYPTGALFNHECFPAVARHFVGRRLVLTATRPLAPGEAAAECYGPAAALRDAASRRRALAARYWFTCACAACQRPQLWPTLAECKDQPPPLKCVTAGCSGVLPGARPAPAQGARCGSCGVTVDAAALEKRIDIVDDCHALFQEGARLMDEEDVAGARRVLCAALARFHGAAAAPRRAALLAHEALRACCAAAGNAHYVRLDQHPSEETQHATTPSGH